MVKDQYTTIGIMSGTSLDGLDVALCNFTIVDGCWNYSIVDAVTFPYPDEWVAKLNEARDFHVADFLHLHKGYGRFIGSKVLDFLTGYSESVDFIASHGHTIFHTPETKLTFQLGDGAEIAAITGIPVVSDFRSLDVAMGGQGAPLVPIGDALLFSKYGACLNLGGIANISYENQGSRIAFDICPVNMAINYITRVYFKREMDKNGELARNGAINKSLLGALDALEFYNLSAPKSLGREWFEDKFLPVLKNTIEKPENILRTLYEHITGQLANSFRGFQKDDVLLTGGGAKNEFMIELLKDKTDKTIYIPHHFLIDYKEALIFAFLGVLRWRNEINCLASVTGAKRDSSGGCICIPTNN